MAKTKELPDADVLFGLKQNADLPDANELFGIKTTDLQPGTVNQEAGSIINPKSLIPKKEDLPELIASTAMGVATGLKSNPVTAIPAAGLSALASAGGEGYRQIGQRMGVFEGEPPQTMLESAKKLGMAGLRGAVGETIGRGVTSGVPKVFAPGLKGAEREAIKTAETELGTKLPLSKVINNKFTQVLEKTSEYSPFGKWIGRQRQNVLNGFKDYSKRVGTSIASDRPMEVQGNLAKESLVSFKANYDATVDRLYDSVPPEVKKIPVDVEPIISKIKDILGRRSGTAQPAGVSELKDWLKQLSGHALPQDPIMGGQKVIGHRSVNNFGELAKFKTNIGSKGKWNNPASVGIESDLKELYGTVRQVMDGTLEKNAPDALGKIKEADEYYGEGLSTLRSKLFKGIAGSKPENVYKSVIQPRGRETVAAGRELLGEDTFRDITRQWYDDLVKGSFITSKETGEEVLSPSKLLSKLSRYDDSVIKEVFADNPQALEQFKRLKDVSTILSRGKDISQGSQTAFAQQSLLPILLTTAQYIWSRQPLHAAAMLSGTLGLQAAENVGTKLSRDWLVDGFPSLAKAAGAIGRTSQVAGQRLMQMEQQ